MLEKVIELYQFRAGKKTGQQRRIHHSRLKTTFLDNFPSRLELISRMETIIESTNKDSIQEAIVTNFVKLLGGSSNGSLGVSKHSDFLSCLSDALSDSDVVCKVPTLEMPAESKQRDGKAALPSLGQSSKKGGVPKMAASVLSPTAEPTQEGPKDEANTAKKMATTTSWTKSTVVYAAPAMAKNISEAFTSLVQSRVKAWTLLLLRHSLQNGNNTTRTSLLGMLSSAIEMKVTITKFRTLPLPEAARAQAKESDVVLPLLFEVAMVASVQGRDEKVSLRAPGTVSANFADGDSPGIKEVEVILDTNALLDSMVEQARLLVFKAVARATGNTPGDSRVKQEVPDRVNPRRGMAGFSSALNLSADAASASPRLQKARSSALRLNSILEGKSDSSNAPSLSKTRKNRSVQWAAPFEKPSKDVSNFPDAKRQRSIQSQARLRSMKSFGRPHGGSSGGPNPNNATFNDFGGRGGPTWGRDGKLKNHPTPGSRNSSVFGDLESSVDQKRQNATFDFGPGGSMSKRSARISPALSSGLNFSRRSSGMTKSMGVPGSLPRTATALESWLVNKSQGI